MSQKENTGKDAGISIPVIKRKLIFWLASIMAVFLFSSQLFVYFNSTRYDKMGATIPDRLKEVFAPSVVGIYFIMLLITIIIILGVLKPLFKYLKDRSHYDKARTASLKVPWVILITQTIFWVVGVTVFFILRDWELSSGYSYFFVYAQKLSVGMISSITCAQIINLILLEAKVELKITNIRKGENDHFNRIKDVMTNISILFIFITYFGSLTYYHYTSEWGMVTIFEFRLSFILTALFLSLSSLTLILLSRREFNQQVRFMHNRMEELAKGGADLSKRVVMLTFNEFGDIARLINDFISHLNKDFKSLRNLVIETGKDAEHVSQSARSLSDRSVDQTEKMDTIAQTMEKFTAIMDKVKGNVSRETEIIQMNASAAEELNRGIESISFQAQRVNKKTVQNLEAADQSMNIVNSSVDSTLKMSDKMKEIADMIKNVGDQSEQIDEIITTIQNISENTDMLSMNAAIEAAHAGEAGKGFAIVAQEIRELAELSSRSASDISGLVHNIKQSIIDAVAMSTMGEVEAEQGKRMAEEAGQALNTIRKNMSEANAMIEEISNVTGEQKNLSEHFLEGVESLTNFSNSIQSAIDEQAMEAVNIDHNLQELSRHNEENTRASSQLAELSEDLKTLGDRLNLIVAQFQLDEVTDPAGASFLQEKDETMEELALSDTAEDIKL